MAASSFGKSLNEAQVECSSKGKARYEFGNKLSFAVTGRENCGLQERSHFLAVLLMERR